MIKPFFLALLVAVALPVTATPLGSKHAIVIDEQTGQVLFEKNATDIVPIASLTKLMTAMVVLDAHPDMQEPIEITEEDVDTLKFSSSRVPVGAVLPRHTLLELALMSSDNRAAHALARTYPGGMKNFLVAVRNKSYALNLRRTNIEEPTGLSPFNTSTASDLAKLTMAAARYPEIERITTVSGDLIEVDGSPRHYHNTNRLVGDKNWNILLSKTGFTKEAGRCIVMRVRAAGRDAVMVLLNARATANRTADANVLHRLLTGSHNTEVMAGLHLQ
ncbi:MAG TPA: serine hydrolase [Oxalicibacterium sp.]|uniref:serine hydrolase n=1 Tax=Oxalicibacterium sp. TaxID=2766525 RepID=UPI002C8FFC65|nr:serine hydrolase [Oxalicibacterium sp.]HWU97566.1 serine hydrolase [Oxalicibacterium sp.]